MTNRTKLILGAVVGVLLLCAAAGNVYYETLPGLVVKHPVTGVTTLTINGTNGNVNSSGTINGWTSVNGNPTTAGTATVDGYLNASDGKIGLVTTTATIPKPFVCFCFDDSILCAYTVFKPYLDAKGWVGNIAAIVSTVTSGNPSFIGTNELTSLQNAGWEIVNGSYNHTDLSTNTTAGIEHEVNDARTALQSLGYSIKNFVYPGVGWSQLAECIIRQHHRAGLLLNSGAAIPPFKEARLPIRVISSANLAQWKSDVDTALAGNYLLVFDVEGSACAVTNEFSQLLDYIQARNISVGTIAEGLKNNGNLEEGQAFYVDQLFRFNINSQTTARSGLSAGANAAFTVQSNAPVASLVINSTGTIGVGTTNELARFVILSSSTTPTNATLAIARLGSDYASAPTSTLWKNSYLHIGGGEYTVNSYRLISFGYHSTSSPQTNVPAFIGYQEKTTAGMSSGDIVFGTRSVTTDSAPDNIFRADTSGVFTAPGGLSTTGPVQGGGYKSGDGSYGITTNATGGTFTIKNGLIVGWTP